MTPAPIDHRAATERESARFRAVLAPLGGTEPVPSCPGWTADDLLHHLGQVQQFWARILHDGLTTDAQVRAVEPPPRGSHAELLAGFDTAHARLRAALAATAPLEHRWSWAREQTAGFTHRRQAHEVLIHRVDAELTAGVPLTPLDPTLAADGVHEALTVMFGEPPLGSGFTATPGQVVRVVCEDTGDVGTFVVGAFSETTEDGPRPVPCLDLAPPGAEITAEVSGPAAELDRWLWQRPAAPPRTSGDPATLAAFHAVLAEPLN